MKTMIPLRFLLLLTGLFGLMACSSPIGPPLAPIDPTATAIPTLTPEPIIPTVTPVKVGEQSAESAATPYPIPNATESQLVTAYPVPVEIQSDVDHFPRFGISGWGTGPSAALEAGMGFSQFLNWSHEGDPLLPDSVTHWKMLRASNDPAKAIDWASVEAVVLAEPGSVWIVGNEMDVKWQDNVSAETYAQIYHDAYTRLKTLDPSSQVAFGGISQATPIRIAYLNDVLASYETLTGEKLPADLFTVHAYVLREERDSWGVDIPPGMDDVNTGKLYEIDDHASLDLFIEQLGYFRQWMADNGYREKPLAVTEFGILLPADYGFASETVADYMRNTIRLMLSTTNEVTGFSADENRLVQTWFWYVVEDSADRYPTSNLFDSEQGQLTLLGETWRDIVEEIQK
ncbi:MAG: hypothetical protein ACPG8W_14025 [Candidatus Promineifilaceae bacterium]